VPRQQQRDRAGQQVQQHRDVAGEPQAEELDQHEPGQHRAHHGPQRVGRVQLAEPGTGLLQGADQVPGEHRQGHAHEQRRRCHGGEGEREAHRGELRGCFEQLAVGAPVDVAEAAEDERQDQPEERDAQLQRPVEHQWPAAAVGQAAAEQAAEPEAGQERGDDGGDRLGGVAEYQHQLPGPDHLVDEPGRAGGDEDGEDRWSHAATGGGRRSGGGGTDGHSGSSSAAGRSDATAPGDRLAGRLPDLARPGKPSGAPGDPGGTLAQGQLRARRRTRDPDAEDRRV
jgi:hypothetical protein